MSTGSLTYQQSVFKRYMTVIKHCQSFYLQDGGKNQLAQIRNKVTSLSVTLCIAGSKPAIGVNPRYRDTGAEQPAGT